MPKISYKENTDDTIRRGRTDAEVVGWHTMAGCCSAYDFLESKVRTAELYPLGGLMMRIDDLPPGEAMNRLVAEHIVNCTDDTGWPYHFTDENGAAQDRLPQYSSVVADAWLLVTCSKMFVDICKIGDYNDPWYVVYVRPAGPTPVEWSPASAEAETMPLALCRAALKMVGVHEYED